MATKRDTKQEYFCIMVKRNYEDVWRVISKYDTREAAEDALAEKRAYTGAFNYDNAELRVITRAEGKKQFGSSWEYVPIGSKGTAEQKPKKATRTARAAVDED